MRDLRWPFAWVAALGLSFATDAGFAADSLSVARPSVSRQAQTRNRQAISDQQLAGFYRSVQNSGEIWIASLGKGALQLALGPNRLAIGFWDGQRFRGVWRPSENPASSETYGEIRFEIASGDTIRAQIWAPGSAPPELQSWVRSARVDTMPTRTPPTQRAHQGVAGDSLPSPGEYVPVEELPEAITKVAPIYPESASKQGVEGTVVINALVGKDGRVKDTRVITSIPLLDDAAMAAVRQLLFKPAMAKGAPVAVWVAVPVKFSRH